MSWQLRKTNVSLRVTRFAPKADTPVAGLTPEQRAEYRQARERECAKVEPAVDLDADLGAVELPEEYEEDFHERTSFYHPYG